MTESTSTRPAEPALAAGSISIRQALLFGLAGLTLGGVLAAEGSYLIGSSGYSSWLAVIVTTAFALFLAVLVTQFARRHVVSGSLMSYLRHEIGPRAGLFGGSSLFVGYAGILTASMSLALYFGFSAMDELGLSQPSKLVTSLVAAVVTAVCCVLARRGVSVSVNVAILLGFIGIPIVGCVIVAAALQSGLKLAPQFTLQDFSLAGFVAGLVVIFGIYCGFEGLTALARETKDPRKTVPVVVISLVAILGVAALISVVMTLPLMVDNADKLAAGQSPLAVMAEVGHVGWLAAPSDTIMAIACVGSLLAYLNDSSRVVATAGRDGFLPAWIGAINKDYRTPAAAIFAMGPCALVLLVVYLALGSDGLLGATINFTMFVSYAWCLAYIGICVAGARCGRRDGKPWQVIGSVLTIAFLLFIAVYTVATSGTTARVFIVVALAAVAAILAVGLIRYRRGGLADAELTASDAS